MHSEDAAPARQFTHHNVVIGTATKGPRPQVAPRSSGLTINAAFDSGIQNDPRASDIMSTIISALAVYQQKFSDPVTINVTYHKSNSGLGASDTNLIVASYSDYLAALKSAATTPDDATALAHLPNTTDNPVDGTANMYLTTALARTLGFSTGLAQGQADSDVFLNISLMNITSADTNPNKYSLAAVVWHETDEAIGLGSQLDSGAKGPVYPEDLFRYDANGNRSFTTSASAESFFSIDGTTDLAQFNQDGSGDYGDWYSVNGGQIPQVQDAFGTPGSAPVLGVELRVLDVIGYTRVLGTPNLTLASNGGVTGPASVRAGGPITVSAPVTNNGTGPAGSFSCRFVLSTDMTFDNSDAVIGDKMVASLDSGATTTVTLNGTCPTIAGGSYYLIVFIDNTNAVAESNESDNIFAAATQVTVIADHPPVISSPATCTPNPVAVGTSAMFTAAATDADNDSLNYTWDFGDGTGTGSGASTSYTYKTQGIYTATVTVTDGFGGSVESSVQVHTFYGINTATAVKKTFTLNFKTKKDTITVTLSSPAFATLPTSAAVEFVIGDVSNNNGTVIDQGTLKKTTAKGTIGNFTVNTHAKTAAYTTTKATLQALLAPDGATNATQTKTQVTVPIYILFNNGYYGGTFIFLYTATAGKTGKGS